MNSKFDLSKETLKLKNKVISVAPMMKWTDRHCRFFHRQLSKSTLLYTEMISSNAVIMGNRKKLLEYSNEEQPLAIQLGGSDPKQLSEAAKICTQYGYKKINLNVGCPSPKVKKGRFGACLMAEPSLVAKCLSEMRSTSGINVTVKCRIGIDDMDEVTGLDNFIEEILNNGTSSFIIHARKALLNGLSPKENREIPPLNYQRVRDLKIKFGESIHVTVNGGIKSYDDAKKLLQWSDGIMIGREAYKAPFILTSLENLIHNNLKNNNLSRLRVSELMSDYASVMIKKYNIRIHSITRHMLGLYSGLKGARSYRRELSEMSNKYNSDPNIIVEAAVMAESLCKDISNKVA